MTIRDFAGKAVVIASLGLLAVVLLAVFLPQIRQLWLDRRAEEVQVGSYPGGPAGSEDRTLDLKIYTVLGKDAIPAILDPKFVTPAKAKPYMLPDERVLGVSINGDHRAYPLNMLSRHEIVNDRVGGMPIAVTW